MTLTVMNLGTRVSCDHCKATVGTLYDGEIHVRAGKQVMIGRDVRVTCPSCGHLNFFGVVNTNAVR